MKLTFDYYHNLEKVELRLCNPDGRELFPLPGKNRNLTLRFNDLSELTFEVDSKVTLSNGNVVTLEAYDYIQPKRLVYATDIGWFQISSVDEHDNGIVKSKSVAAESLQAVLKNKGFLVENRVYCFYNPQDPHDDHYDASKEDAIPSVLGQMSKQLGIRQALGQGLYEPEEPYDDWTVTYVHPSLVYTGEGSICRTFKDNVTFGYDWIANEVENAFEVVVVFDFMYKTIHVMTPGEVAQKVNVIYTFKNFMKSIDINENADNIVTVLNCKGNNCDILAVNPTGTNYICDFSYYMDKVNYRWMSSALISKLELWMQECEENKDGYTALVQEMRELEHERTKYVTNLQESSIRLQDLKNAQGKRSVVGNGEPGKQCGTVVAEYVQTRRQIVDGIETVTGGKSIKPGTRYHTSEFTGTCKITAYERQPKYDTASKKWIFSGASKTGTADSIIADNLAEDNFSGITYLYFSDSSDGSSYCELESASIIRVDEQSATMYCGGFLRYIAYTYPIIEPGSGKMIFTDTLQSWIDLHEGKVSSFNRSIEGYDGRIKEKDTALNQISSRLNLLSYFSNTPELLRELNCYWIEGDYVNENIAVLEKTTPEQEIDLANELLEAGRIELSKVCQPRLSFSIESIDAMRQYEFRNQMQLLELGKVITIEKEEGLWYYPALIEMSMSLDGGDNFTMTFANAMRLDDWGYTYADLISDASATSRKVSASWQDILAYSKEREEITSLIRDPLDTTLRASFANAINQNFTVDKNGILGRKKLSETSEDFEDEQVRLINNLLIFTDDNWQTAKTALGKVYYMDEDGNQITSYGLVAETIIGSLIMGERLKIMNSQSTVELGAEGISIKQADGTVVFAAKPDGTISVKSYVTEDDVTHRLEGYLTASGLEMQLSNYTTEGELTDRLKTYVTATGLETRLSSYATNSYVQNQLKSVVTSDGLDVTLERYLTTTGGLDSSFSWSMSADGLRLKANSQTVMEVTSAGLEITGKITADNGYIGNLAIESSGLTGYSSSNVAAWFLNTQGLHIPSTSAKISVGNLSIYNALSGGMIKTYLKTSGDLVLTADSGASLSFSSDSSTEKREGTIEVCARCQPTINGATYTGTWVKVRTNVAPFYDCTVSVTVREYDVSSYDGEEYNIRTATGELIIPAGKTESEPLMFFGNSAPYMKVMLGNGSWSAGIKMRGDSGYIDWTVFTNDKRYSQTKSASQLAIKGHVLPQSSNAYDLGTSSKPWKTVFTQDGTVKASDYNVKNTIQPLTDVHERIFDALLPVSYVYNNNSSNRKHFGFIAQDVKSAIIQSGLTTQDFAGYCEWLNEDGSPGCGLRYDEFIALNTYEIQKLKLRIKALERVIDLLTRG